jgi:light-regulated signal transduction histidine kinase (bacteriophytochrome)
MRMIDEHHLTPELTPFERLRGAATDVTVDHRLAARNIRRKCASTDDGMRERREHEQFVSAVLHDLRSPLINLQGFSAELAASCQKLRSLIAQPGVPAELREAALALINQRAIQSLEFIRGAVSRVGSIVDSLLRLSLFGSVEYCWQTVDVGAVVRRVVDATLATIAKRDALVTVHELPAVWSDPMAIEIIFPHLIGKAPQYPKHAQSGVTEIGAAQSSGARRATKGDSAIYCVRDNGVDIPENCLDKVL